MCSKYSSVLWVYRRHILYVSKLRRLFWHILGFILVMMENVIHSSLDPKDVWTNEQKYKSRSSRITKIINKLRFEKNWRPNFDWYIIKLRKFKRDCEKGTEIKRSSDSWNSASSSLSLWCPFNLIFILYSQNFMEF